MTTCQICAREIKLVNGLIAHHGFRRPGDGWQTASCWGARFKPYEESCNRIPDVISMLEQEVNANEKAIQELKASPPETLIQISVFNRRSKVLERPSTFDPTTEPVSFKADSYELCFWTRIRNNTNYIRFANLEIQRLRVRLTAWPVILF